MTPTIIEFTMAPLGGRHRAGAYAVGTSLMPLVVKSISLLDVQGRLAKGNPKGAIQGPFILPKDHPHYCLRWHRAL